MCVKLIIYSEQEAFDNHKSVAESNVLFETGIFQPTKPPNYYYLQTIYHPWEHRVFCLHYIQNSTYRPIQKFSRILYLFHRGKPWWSFFIIYQHLFRFIEHNLHVYSSHLPYTFNSKVIIVGVLYDHCYAYRNVSWVVYIRIIETIRQKLRHSQLSQSIINLV